MNCTQPRRITKNLPVREYPDGLSVPCGQCLACRMAKKLEWAVRLTHEQESWEDAVFLTLTYDDLHLPKFHTLEKQEFIKFFKRLRKDLDKEDRKIKYFACGEYGFENDRPHYHAIVFGLGLNEHDKNLVKWNWQKCDWDNQAIVQGSFGMVERKSINYVSGYINKKLTGALADEEYKDKKREPVFKINSNGLGKEYLWTHERSIRENLSVRYHGRQLAIPRYYQKQLRINSQTLRERGYYNEAEKIAKITGLHITEDELMRSSAHKEQKVYVSSIGPMRKQHNKNLNAKLKISEDRK